MKERGMMTGSTALLLAQVREHEFEATIENILGGL
jgi:hypothetical protein